MRMIHYFVAPAAILLALASPLAAQTATQAPAQELTQTQDPADPPQAQPQTPLPLGGFQIQGSASMGYRFTNVYGFQPMYNTLFDLNTGPRLMDFNLFGHAETPNPFADDFSLTLNGLGGDPFPTAQLTVSKNKRYDLRATWQQAYFYEAGNNEIALPTLGVAGLTNNLDFATVERSGPSTWHSTQRMTCDFASTTTAPPMMALRSPLFRPTFSILQASGGRTPGACLMYSIHPSITRPTVSPGESITRFAVGRSTTSSAIKLTMRR